MSVDEFGGVSDWNERLSQRRAAARLDGTVDPHVSIEVAGL